MKDIAKMKADFTKQIEMAELENSINSKLLASLPNGYEIFLYEATGRKEKDRGVKYDLHTSVSVHNPHSKYRIGSTTYTANNRPSSSLATMSPALLSKELSILKNNPLSPRRRRPRAKNRGKISKQTLKNHNTMASIFDLCTKQGATPETQNFVLVAGDRAYWTNRFVICATEAPEGLRGPAERWYNRDAVGAQVPWTIVNKKRCEELLAEHSEPESISGDLPVASIEGLAPLWDFVTYASISAYTNGGGNVCCAIDTIEDFAYFGPEILRTFLKACKVLKIDTCSVYFREPSKALEGARIAMLRGHNSETNSVVIAQGYIPRGTPKGAECLSDKLGAIVLNACPDHIGIEYFGDADCEKPRHEGESYIEFLKRYALEGVHEQKEIDKVNKMYNRITKYNVI